MNFYYAIGSPPCMAVLLVIKELGLKVNSKLVDMMDGEHLKPEFLKMNPAHMVPTLEDNGFAIGESRAIMTYLIDKYAKNDSLYPKDVQKRATVNQRLYFDLGTLYVRFSNYYYSVLIHGDSFDPEKLKKIEEAFKILDDYLAQSEFVTGNTLTVADFSIVGSVMAFECAKFDFTPYKNVQRWYKKVKETAVGYEEIENYASIFKEWMESTLKSLKK